MLYHRPSLQRLASVSRLWKARCLLDFGATNDVAKVDLRLVDPDHAWHRSLQDFY